MGTYRNHTNNHRGKIFLPHVTLPGWKQEDSVPAFFPKGFLWPQGMSDYLQLSGLALTFFTISRKLCLTAWHNVSLCSLEAAFSQQLKETFCFCQHFLRNLSSGAQLPVKAVVMSFCIFVRVCSLPQEDEGQLTIPSVLRAFPKKYKWRISRPSPK